MKKRPGPNLSPTAFSIASQFTGPPFSVMLESAELHRHLMEEMAAPAGRKVAKARSGKKPARKSATKGKARKKSAKKK